MPPSTTPHRQALAEKYSSRVCEPCRRTRSVCNGQHPCTHCTETNGKCVYVLVSDTSRSVFSTTNARRLSSGSACETCRRRKTKCDGSSPCGFCSANEIDCVNYSERKKRTAAAPQDSKVIGRIENRLRRIEHVISVIQPGSLSASSSSSVESPIEEHRTKGTLAFRKLSSPHPTQPPYFIRPHRHSVQGISATKEQTQLRSAWSLPAIVISPISSTSTALKSAPCMSTGTARSTPSMTPPLSPTGSLWTSGTTQPLTSSMLNLTLSPSSSTSTCSTTTSSTLPIQSPSAVRTPRTAHHPSQWKTVIPSVTDQLSRHTFASTHDYPLQYPIYPLESHDVTNNEPILSLEKR